MRQIEIGQGEPGNPQRRVDLTCAIAIGKRGAGESTGGLKEDEV